VQTVDGGYALAGDSPGLGDDDFWLVKTDASGNEVWNMTYGGTGEDVAFSVVQTRDGGYALAGDTYSFDAGGYNAWLVKTDASGNMLWNKTYGGTGTDEAWCVVQTGDGGYAVAGYTNSIGAGHADAWLVKIAASSTADSFRFPLDGFWTVRQRFGGYNYDWNGYHLGEDVLRSFEAPVFAPADGVVKHSAKRTGYGYVVIIEHQLMDGTFVCSVLGHLREADRVPVGAKVTKGQIVGYLSSVPEENGGIIHLHFGIRKGMYSEELDSDGKWRYRGY
jgi:hypothetical protein